MRTPRIIVAIVSAALATAACTSGSESSGKEPSGGTERTYFIAADPVEWNYAPDGNMITGEAFGDSENVYVARAKDRIGSTYAKCLYRGYTDDTFREEQSTEP